MQEELKPVAKSVEKKIYNLLKDNQRQIKRGANEVTKQVDRSKALLVVIAANAEPVEIVCHLPLICDDKGIPYVVVEDKDALGTATGLERHVISCCLYANDDRDYDRVKNGIGQIIAEVNGTSK